MKSASTAWSSRGRVQLGSPPRGEEALAGPGGTIRKPSRSAGNNVLAKLPT